DGGGRLVVREVADGGDDDQARIGEPQAALGGQGREGVALGRHQQGGGGDGGGELGDVVRDRSLKRLQQHAAVGEAREVAAVLGVDPPAQRLVAGGGHGDARDPGDDRAAQQGRASPFRQRGGEAVVADGEPGRCAAGGARD